MHALIKHRPTPALVIAVLALVTSLSGVSVAATRLPAHEHHSATPKPLTKRQVDKLIATYVKAHKATLRGARGARGLPGPGALVINHVGSSASAQPQTIGTYGLWTIAMTCTATNTTPDTTPGTTPHAVVTPNVSITVDGPGSYTSEPAIATGSGSATSYIFGPESFASGPVTVSASNGSQFGEKLVLASGTTAMSVSFVAAPSVVGSAESCPVLGDAVPLS